MPKLTSAGLVAVLQDGINAFDGAKLKLFKNDFAPAITSTSPASYTPATFTGYSTKTLTSTTPTAAANGSNNGQAAYTEERWDATSSQTIYGWYITNAAETSVLVYHDETLEVVSGAPVVITPTFVAKNPA